MSFPSQRTALQLDSACALVATPVRCSVDATLRVVSQACLLALCGVSLAQAQSTVVAAASSRLDPVIVTATRVPQPVSQAVVDASVFTREDIERRGPGSVADLLRAAPGFEIARSGGPGGTTSCFVRGGENRFVAVLVDGVRMDSQSTGGAPWEAIPLSQIERIEIVRGGVSAVYGSDAIAGVVQIFTRKGEQGGLNADLGVGVGNMGLRKADARLSGGSGAVDYSISLAGERSTGFSAVANPVSSNYAPDTDGYFNRSAGARVGLQLNAEHRLEAGVTAEHMDTQYDAFASKVDDHAVHNSSASHLSWSAQWLQNLRSQLTLGQTNDQYKTRPSVYDTATRLRNLTWVNTLTWGEHVVTGTLERREDRLLNSSLTQVSTPGEGQRFQNAVALGDQWRHGSLSLQANARQDHDSEFGNHATGLLGAALDVGGGVRVRASASNSFRAPTLYQRYSQYGVSSLKPESGFNVEGGVNYRQGDSELGLTAYRNRVRNLIVFGGTGPCPSTVGCYANVGVARLQGVTLDGRTELAGVRLSGSWDLLSPRNADTTDVNNGNLLTRRSRRHASVRLDTDVADWTLGAQVLASGTRYDNAANTEAKRLAGYALLNLDAQWRFAKAWRLETRVDNLFNQAYETAQYYATQPRQLYVGVRWTPAL
jgi:vitamin B12 transporter